MRAAFGTEVEEKLKPRLTPWEVVKRVGVGVYNDGFIHAGNLAYLSIVALFPFFIVAAAVAHLLGQSQDAMLTVTNVLHRLPPSVAATLQEPVEEVLTVRTGNLLWAGAVVGLWTGASFIETIRDILRRAYGVKFCAPFWEYRIGSILLILGAVLLLMLAFAASATLTIAHHLLVTWFPFAEGIGTELNAALAESGATALKGEIYTGPYTDQLQVEEPQPGEDVKPELETGGPQL
jgi:membrane protein